MVIVPPLGISRWPEPPPMLKLKKPPPKNELERGDKSEWEITRGRKRIRGREKTRGRVDERSAEPDGYIPFPLIIPEDTASLVGSLIFQTLFTSLVIYISLLLVAEYLVTKTGSHTLVQLEDLNYGSNDGAYTTSAPKYGRIMYLRYGSYMQLRLRCSVAKKTIWVDTSFEEVCLNGVCLPHTHHWYCETFLEHPGRLGSCRDGISSPVFCTPSLFH